MPHPIKLAMSLGVVALGLLGCGGPDRPALVPVSGQVLIDGKPVEHGTIQVIPKDARAARGTLGPGGTFQLETYEANDGCVPGTHQVIVMATEPQTGGQKWHAPQKYKDAATSGLTVEIKEPTTSLTIELSWDGGKPFVERFPSE